MANMMRHSVNGSEVSGSSRHKKISIIPTSTRLSSVHERRCMADEMDETII